MDCESIPSCAEMGYTQDSCSGGKGVRCPFDENKFYCAGVKQLPDAPEPVVTPEDWTAGCADKINYCTAYNTECQCTACEDTYLISDGACVPECDKSVDICAAENKTFNSANCVCEACPTNYQFNSETKACEQIACDKTKVEHCATYSSDYEPCTCQACELNYLLVDGICKKMCTKVENCTTYDSEYDPCNCTACEDGYIFENGACVVDPCIEKCKIAYPLFAGQDNTNAAIDQIGNKALAAYAAHQFYVGDKNGDFGQGKWYLPSIGEWMYFYGTDTSKMTNGTGTTGATGNTKTLINNALNTLAGKGAEAEACLYDMWHWSSSESTPEVWILNGDTGYLYYYTKDHTLPLRFSLLLKNIFNPSAGGTAPQIGDVMYLDKTYGAAADYDGSKTPVGVISSVSPTGRDVTIMNLKYPIFHGFSYAGNFNPENPYGVGQSDRTFWSIGNTDISGIPNISSDQLLELAQASGNCPCQFYEPDCKLNTLICAAENKIFKEDTCTCEACPENRYFNSDYQTCECVDGYTESSNGSTCCQDIEGCASYDMSCSCTRCNDTRLMGSGGCYLATFCDFENCNAYHCESCKAYFCEDYKTCWPTNNICKDCSPAISGSWFRPWKGSLDEQNNACKDRYAQGGSVESKSYCAPGAIMYDDFKCYPTEQSDKTPIGVTAYVSKDKVLVLALDDSDERELLSGTASVYINCNSNNGKEQTECLVANGIEEYSAPAYCNSYGVTEADKGKWFLPTNSEFETIYEHYLTNTLHGYTSSTVASYTYKGQFCFTVQTLHKYNDPSSDILEYVNSKFLNRNFWTSTRGDYQASLTLTMGYTASPASYKRVQNGERGLVRCVLEVPFEDTVL